MRRGAPVRLHAPAAKPSHWKSARTTNAIERLPGEYLYHIKAQTVLLYRDNQTGRSRF